MKRKPKSGTRILYWAGEVLVQNFEHDTQHRKIYEDANGKRFYPSEEDIMKDFQEGNGFKEYYDNTHADGFIREQKDEW